ncbi:PIN domain-containing protein [Curtobacterium sp. 1310]|uniref:type II toxin-antitoxin system VapC family toxin n=1 Tax=Curtobacterium sp. 1310 TaxID=2806570 RepID=UPI001AE77935|nr:PIN domain-containing protein [Curtobacterium sp. 1310]MBP1300768.1 putative nucleic acid-binding protein [Curtobacterium sp. 1310]
MVLDANVVIALLDEGDGLHERAYDLVEDHAWDEFCTSALTLAEMLVRPASRGHADRERGTIERLGVSVVPVTGCTARRAADIRASRRLGMPDAVVLVTAQAVHGQLATFDRKLRRIAQAEGLDLAEPDDDGGPWPFPT